MDPKNGSESLVLAMLGHDLLQAAFVDHPPCGEANCRTCHSLKAIRELIEKNRADVRSYPQTPFSESQFQAIATAFNQDLAQLMTAASQAKAFEQAKLAAETEKNKQVDRALQQHQETSQWQARANEAQRRLNDAVAASEILKTQAAKSAADREEAVKKAAALESKLAVAREGGDAEVWGEWERAEQKAKQLEAELAALRREYETVAGREPGQLQTIKELREQVGVLEGRLEGAVRASKNKAEIEARNATALATLNEEKKRLEDNDAARRTQISSLEKHVHQLKSDLAVACSVSRAVTPPKPTLDPSLLAARDKRIIELEASLVQAANKERQARTEEDDRQKQSATVLASLQTRVASLQTQVATLQTQSAELGLERDRALEQAASVTPERMFGELHASAEIVQKAVGTHAAAMQALVERARQGERAALEPPPPQAAKPVEPPQSIIESVRKAYQARLTWLTQYNGERSRFQSGADEKHREVENTEEQIKLAEKWFAVRGSEGADAQQMKIALDTDRSKLPVLVEEQRYYAAYLERLQRLCENRNVEAEAEKLHAYLTALECLKNELPPECLTLDLPQLPNEDEVFDAVQEEIVRESLTPKPSENGGQTKPDNATSGGRMSHPAPSQLMNHVAAAHSLEPLAVLVLTLFELIPSHRSGVKKILNAGYDAQAYAKLGFRKVNKRQIEDAIQSLLKAGWLEPSVNSVYVRTAKPLDWKPEELLLPEVRLEYLRRVAPPQNPEHRA